MEDFSILNKLIEDRKKSQFQRAYDSIGGGQNFVRIHWIRELLPWTVDQFDDFIVAARRENWLQLHGGDPSKMTREQIRDSFTDSKDRLYITCCIK